LRRLRWLGTALLRRLRRNLLDGLRLRGGGRRARHVLGLRRFWSTLLRLGYAGDGNLQRQSGLRQRPVPGHHLRDAVAVARPSADPRSSDRLAGAAGNGEDAPMIFEQVRRGSCLSYLIGCEETCNALVIDQHLDGREPTGSLGTMTNFMAPSIDPKSCDSRANAALRCGRCVRPAARRRSTSACPAGRRA
jgi:hypothetical protein